jgi:hypothetical protein
LHAVPQCGQTKAETRSLAGTDVLLQRYRRGTREQRRGSGRKRIIGHVGRHMGRRKASDEEISVQVWWVGTMDVDVDSTEWSGGHARRGGNGRLWLGIGMHWYCCCAVGAGIGWRVSGWDGVMVGHGGERHAKRGVEHVTATDM